MKISKYLWIIYFIGLIGCSFSDKGRDISFLPREEEKYGLRIQKSARITALDKGQLFTFDENIVYQLDLKTLKINNNEIVVEASLPRIKFEANSNVGKIIFDSDRQSKEMSFLTKPFEKLINQKFLIYFDKIGHPIKIENYQAIYEQALNEADSLNPIISKTVKELITNEFSQSAISEILRKINIGYVDESKSLNDKWKKETHFECYGVKVKTSSELELIDRSNGTAVIEIKCFADGENVTTTGDILFYEGSFTGRVMIDEIGGWVKKANMHYVLINKNERNREFYLNENIILNADVILKIDASSDQIFRKITFSPASVIKGDGFGLTFVGMSVVFSSLLLLFIVFSYFRDILELIEARSNKKPHKEEEQKSVQEKKEEMTGEIIAAISAALHLYSQEIHDQETRIITIQKVSRTYSPWSSKIYSLRKHPRL